MTRQPLPLLSALLARVRPLLEARRLPLVLALLGALLVSPSLFAGLATEDWVERVLITKGEAPLPEHLNLFGHDTRWTDADTVKRDTEYQIYGWLPWLTDRHFDASFWRPLASLTHHLDYRAWPDHPWVMHAESVLWYAGAVLAVAWLHRRLIDSRWTAALASLLYAVDDAHGQPVGWLINRNGVMATLFAVLSLLSYDRYRRDQKKGAAWLTVLFLGLALGSAEFALCIAGYFVSYTLFVEEEPWARRLSGAAVYAVPLLVWAVLYRHLGHATHGSGLYIDPVRDPVSYGFELVERCTVLLMGQIGGPFSDTWAGVEPYAQGFLVFFAAALVWGVTHVLWPLLRADRRARFWAAGLVLSLLPAGATFPEDRLLLLAGVGAFPLVAACIAAIAERPAWALVRPRLTLGLGLCFLTIHGVLAPLLLPYRTLKMFRYEQTLNVVGDSAFALGARAKDEALILVNAEDYYFAGMMGVTHVARVGKIKGRVLTVAGTLEEVVIRRATERSLEVTPKHGFLSRAFNRIYRSRTAPFARGARVELGGVHVTVTEVTEWGEPVTAVFTFAFPLEYSHYRWAIWKDGLYVPFALPEVGTTVVVGGA